MHQPMISVVIPVYNHAREVLECLASLSCQTFRDFEVIMVDDGSNDDLPTALRQADGSFERTSDESQDEMAEYAAASFAGHGFPLRIIRFPVNRGAPAARNEGFRRSSGHFIICLDADVVLQPQALQEMLHALLLHPSAAFAFSSFYFGWKLFRGQAFSHAILKERNYIHTSSLIRREAFVEFDETLKKFQDWDVWLTMAERGLTGVWIEQPLFRIKPRRGGMSRWVPAFVYRLPWKTIGFTPKIVQTYEDAEAIIRHKHKLA